MLYRLRCKTRTGKDFGPLLTDPVGRVVAVIPCHNEVDTIAATVKAVLWQTRPPDELFVLIDNREDRELGNQIAEKLSPYGVTVTQTVRNEYKKAGNLNAGLDGIMPGLEFTDVVMGFDADSTPAPEFIENAVRWLEQGYGSVGDVPRTEGRRSDGAAATRRVRPVRRASAS